MSYSAMTVPVDATYSHLFSPEWSDKIRRRKELGLETLVLRDVCSQKVTRAADLDSLTLAVAKVLCLHLP